MREVTLLGLARLLGFVEGVCTRGFSPPRRVACKLLGVLSVFIPKVWAFLDWSPAIQSFPCAHLDGYVSISGVFR